MQLRLGWQQTTMAWGLGRGCVGRYFSQIPVSFVSPCKLGFFFCRSAFSASLVNGSRCLSNYNQFWGPTESHQIPIPIFWGKKPDRASWMGDSHLGLITWGLSHRDAGPRLGRRPPPPLRALYTEQGERHWQKT